MMRKSLGLLVALLTFATGASAATFNLFSPAAGILKGNPSTYVTTAAASSDIIATFSGTCNASSFLRGDGACATPTGTSVGANPSASVGTAAVNGVATTFMRSDASPPISQSITPTWSGVHTFSAAPIFSSLTGPLKGNGASAVGLAASADIYGLWSGTCNNTTFLRGDGTCAAGAGGSGANPTASIGLTAVNGVAASFIRSDGAPALSQAIVPTWTGQHAFTAPQTRMAPTAPGGAAAPILAFDDANTGFYRSAVGEIAITNAGTQSAIFKAAGLQVNTAIVPDTNTGADIGTSSLLFNTLYGISMCSSTCASHQLVSNSGLAALFGGGSIWTSISLPKPTTVSGLLSATGGVAMLNNSSLSASLSMGGSGKILLDNGAGSFLIQNTAGSVTYMSINNLNGEVNYVAPTGSFNVTTEAGGGSCTANWTKSGYTVTIIFGTTGTCTGTSSTTGGPFFCSGCLPSAILPQRTQTAPISVYNNSLDAFGMARVFTNGNVSSGCGATIGGGCTASGTKGVQNGPTFTYSLL